MHPIVLTADHAQRRVKRDRLTVLAEGSYKAERGGRVTGWDEIQSVDIWQDQITYTAMLMPGPMDAENWATSDTGIYSKYTTGDLTFTDSSGWIDTPVPGSLGWIKKPECNDDYITTPTLSNINQGMWVARYGFGAADNFVLFECGWSDDHSRFVAFRVWSSGDVEVWKGDELVGKGKISGAKTTSKVQEQWIGIMFLPFRRREMLVYSNQGDGFSHLFTDLPEDGEVQEIVPATKFWVKIPTGTATIQIAPIQFKSSGTLYSTKRYFATPPPTPAPGLHTEAIYDGAGYGTVSATASVVKADLSGAFTPDGTEDECALQVDLSGGAASPFVYAAFAAYDQEIVETDDSEAQELEWKELSWSVPDSPNGASFRATIRDPENAGVDRLTMISNRPILIESDSAILLDGRGGEPKIRRGRIDDLDYLDLEIYDSWKALEHYRFQERLPLDGLSWKVAVELMFTLAGFDISQLDVEDPGLTLGLASSPTAGEWSVLVNEGDTAADWVERLFDGFAADWFYSLIPQASGLPKFVAKSPTSLSEDPDIELFTDRADAYDQLVTEGMDPADAERYAHMRLIQAISETRIMPEATDIRVTGIDLRANKYLQAKYVDENAQDPEIAPTSRPDNWLGERLRFGYLEPMLTTQELVDDAASKLGDRITRVRTMVDIDTHLLVKPDGALLWRGGVIRVNGDKKYRVRSFSGRSGKDVDLSGGTGIELSCWRPTTYCGELIDPNAPWGIATGAIGSEMIGRNQLRRLGVKGAKYSGFFQGLVRLDK